ncbi:MAG: GntR family transcriptional regulator, partial [Ruminococcus sp.]|nr:GntR family transcriptional regulator [Ruminococcus sp.]
MFQINTASGVPIYEQLIHNVTRLTDSGVLKPHDRLPSVRSLAVELGINPNTVAKAYRELETRGFIYS